MNDNHDRRSEDLAAYLFGALEPEEAADFEHHTRRCERCREELRRLAPAMRALPEAVERHEPPPGLRKRLLAEVREDARRAGGERAGVLGPSRGRLRAHWRPLAALAALLLIAAAIVGLAVGGSGSGGGGASKFVSGHAPGVVATVVREGEHGRLRLRDVPAMPPDRVLEAWVRRGGKVEPVPTLFVPDGEGKASTRLGDLRDVDLVMVTAEPPGGSKAPTSAPIVSVPIG